MNSNKIYNHLKNYSEGDGVYLENPCSIDKINELQTKLNDKVNGIFVNEYSNFLETTNGAQIENAVFYSDKEFLDKVENSNRFEIGYAGNMDAYLYNVTTKKYEITNFFNTAEVFESFDSLTDLMNRVLEVQGVTKSA